MKTFSQYLTEKLIIVGKGKKYGQAILLAGGAGSGKSFAFTHLIDGTGFKYLNSDNTLALYSALAALSKTTRDNSAQFASINWKDPHQVMKIYQFMKLHGIHEKMVDNVVIPVMKGKSQLPNVLLDQTFKDIHSTRDRIELLLSGGYKPEDIHLIWVLADYRVALVRNSKRDRVVPEDILLFTHEGVALTMTSFLKEGLPDGLNGDMYIIINTDDNTIFYADAQGNPLDGKQGRRIAVKDFTYFKIKDSGSELSPQKIDKVLRDWVLKLIPNTQHTAFLFHDKYE